MHKGILLIILSIICSLIFIIPCCADDTPDVYCNGKIVEFDEGPYIIDGFTFVPVRGLSEALNFKYSWDGTNRTVILVSDGVSAWIQADNPAITINTSSIIYSERIDVAPCIIDDRIFPGGNHHLFVFIIYLNRLIRKHGCISGCMYCSGSSQQK